MNAKNLPVSVAARILAGQTRTEAGQRWYTPTWDITEKLYKSQRPRAFLRFRGQPARYPAISTAPKMLRILQSYLQL